MPKASRATCPFPPANLSSIRVLDVVGQHDFKWLEWVLHGSPNITSIACGLSEHWAQIHSMLTTTGTAIKLHKLIVTTPCHCSKLYKLGGLFGNWLLGQCWSG